MLVYIEILTSPPPTMTAFVAVGTCPTSAHQPSTLQMTQANIKALEIWVGFNSNISSSIGISHSTCNNIESCIKTPMYDANNCSYHHDK